MEAMGSVVAAVVMSGVGLLFVGAWAADVATARANAAAVAAFKLARGRA